MSQHAAEICSEAYKQAMNASTLASSVLTNVKFESGEAGLLSDAKVFRAVLDYEISKAVDAPWRLDEEGLSNLTTDYLLLRDYQMGEYRRSLRPVIDTFGIVFFDSPEEYQEYERREKENQKEAADWLLQTVGPRLHPFWYYTFCLCKRLQEGENRLTSTDAYWLGIVDEVAGTKLTGFRSFLEADKSDMQPSNDDEQATIATPSV